MEKKQNLLNQATALKNKLDGIRPLPASVVKDLREDFNIKNTYHSNAIEAIPYKTRRRIF